MTRLTPGELDVMQILWKHGESKPGEIQGLFPRPIKNPALRSYLSILVEKGHVARRKAGKAYYYKARTRQDRVLRSTIRNVVTAFCDGSAKTLMAHLIKTEKISDNELLELKRIAEGREEPESR